MTAERPLPREGDPRWCRFRFECSDCGRGRIGTRPIREVYESRYAFMDEHDGHRWGESITDVRKPKDAA